MLQYAVGDHVTRFKKVTARPAGLGGPRLLPQRRRSFRRVADTSGGRDTVCRRADFRAALLAVKWAVARFRPCGLRRCHGLQAGDERWYRWSVRLVETAGQPRVPRTIGGISGALSGARCAQFFAELMSAEQGPELDNVLNAWWGRAILDPDPDRDSIHQAAETGSLPTSSMDEIRRRRQERAS